MTDDSEMLALGRYTHAKDQFAHWNKVQASLVSQLSGLLQGADRHPMIANHFPERVDVDEMRQKLDELVIANTRLIESAESIDRFAEAAGKRPLQRVAY